MKVLVTRTDRLGDVVLSLPVLADLKARHPDWELHVLVAPVAVPLVENDPHLARVWRFADGASTELARELAAERFDASIMLFYERSLAALLRRIGVPWRVGPLSKPSSWLYLNRGVRQRRSRAEGHERDFNVLLGRHLDRVTGAPRASRPSTPAGASFPDPRLCLTPAQVETGRRFRAEFAPGARAVVFVHPGSGGSALGWPAMRFGAVAAILAAQPGWRLFLTGAAADAKAVSEAVAVAGPLVTSIAGRFELRDFLGVLAAGDLLLAPSTGPLHIAAALGVAALGIFPPVPVQSPARWGPLGSRARALSPAVDCPARLDCWGSRCPHWNCMERIEVDAVVAAAKAALPLWPGTAG